MLLKVFEKVSSITNKRPNFLLIVFLQEKEKFDKVEKEYESAEKVAEEDEAELRLAKKMLKMKL